MEDEFSSLSWEFYYQKEGLEELSQSLLHTTLELKATKEEITRRDCELMHLNDVLSRVIKERDEAEAKWQKLILEKQQQQEELNNSDQQKVVSSSSFSYSDEISKEAFDELVLPEKGKFLKAVMEAGPLLQTLLLAGQLPQWQHPPPKLEIPPPPPLMMMMMMMPISSSNSHHHQHSNNNTSFDCFKNKRDLDSLVSFETPSSSKLRKVIHHL